MVKEKDKVRIHHLVYDTYDSSDSIVDTSRNTVYVVTEIAIHLVRLNPISGRGHGSDGLPYDETARTIVRSRWFGDIDKSFLPVGEDENVITFIVTDVRNHRHRCPLCGALGDDLIFKFFCTNNGCRNWHP